MTYIDSDDASAVIVGGEVEVGVGDGLLNLLAHGLVEGLDNNLLSAYG